MSVGVFRSSIAELRETGFTVLQGFVPDAPLSALNETARLQLAERRQPLELEADLRYPGAPESRESAGGTTIRRLLGAHARAPGFAAWATHPQLAEWMGCYFGEAVLMSQAHHNCLMTKHPRYGSLTGWHRDIRYWSFERESLVSVWIALGSEHRDNGGLWFVPGSHRLDFSAAQFDEARFFRADLGQNEALIHTAVSPPLKAGDAVLFHCNTLHSAGQNLSNAVKFSLVFTYHAASNRPIPGTRSAAQPEIRLNV